jgi:hypothetical protein
MRVAPASARLTVGVSSVAPFPFYRPVAVRRRLNVMSSGVAGFAPASSRIAQPPPLLIPASGVSSLLMGGSVTLSQVKSTVSCANRSRISADSCNVVARASSVSNMITERYAGAIGWVQ